MTPDDNSNTHTHTHTHTHKENNRVEYVIIRNSVIAYFFPFFS